jgi:L-alanine-DL-glutamate epimerase-like enolase superfamily enzyme
MRIAQIREKTDMAVWDAVAKIAEKPLFQLLAERYGNGLPDPKVFVYAAGGYYHPGKGLAGLRQSGAAGELCCHSLHRSQISKDL